MPGVSPVRCANLRRHGLVRGQPKTAKSRRSIALSPAGVDFLHAIRGSQIEQRLSAGDAWQEMGYVFAEIDGSPVIPDKVTQDFARLVKRNRLPHMTFHGLRHAHATLMLCAGVNRKVVSERLGHSNIAITMHIYSHVMPRLQEAAALAVDEKLLNPSAIQLGNNGHGLVTNSLDLGVLVVWLTA